MALLIAVMAVLFCMSGCEKMRMKPYLGEFSFTYIRYDCLGSFCDQDTINCNGEITFVDDGIICIKINGEQFIAIVAENESLTLCDESPDNDPKHTEILSGRFTGQDEIYFEYYESYFDMSLVWMKSRKATGIRIN